MTEQILVTGATGKTGRRLSTLLADSAVPIRRGARRDTDVRFEWDDPDTYDAALDGASAVYLVPPPLRFDHAPLVARFLDRAEVAGVRHVTLLSARGVDQLPAEVPLRAVELDVMGRRAFTSSVLRPGWFLQDFSEWLWQPSIVERGVIESPAGDGAEAFIDADDIAAVAAATLLEDRHAGAEYDLTGPEARTFDDVAAAISAVAGRPVVHERVTADQWAREAIALGIPGDYAELLSSLLAGIAQGSGAMTTTAVEDVTGRPARTLEDFVAAVNPALWKLAA